jgi:hypothetical protein
MLEETSKTSSTGAGWIGIGTREQFSINNGIENELQSMPQIIIPAR